MNKKISLGLTIALIIVSVTATFAITMSVSQRMYNKLITDLPARAQMYSAVEEIDELIRSKYYGEIDEATLNSNIEDGFVRGINDRYSRYMSTDEYKLYSAKLEGRNSGIGVEAQLDPVSGYLDITEVYPNSPAKNEGLQKGDKIIAIGSDTVTAENSSEMLERLNGIKLTSVNITYRRNNEDKTANIVLGYTNQTVSYELMGTTGYIKISAFYKNTLNQLEKAIKELKAGDAKSLIFDVRGTSEGTIEYACGVIDYLVPVASEGNKAMATLLDKDGKTIKTFSSDAQDVTLPMAVLINSQTSGFGELFACDLHDFGKAFLLGENTAGNASVQEIFELSDGGAVLLTTSKVLPYISQSFDGKGLVPDTQVKLTSESQDLSTLSHEDDAQLQAAVSMLADNTAK